MWGRGTVDRRLPGGGMGGLLDEAERESPRAVKGFCGPVDPLGVALIAPPGRARVWARLGYSLQPLGQPLDTAGRSAMRVTGLWHTPRSEM